MHFILICNLAIPNCLLFIEIAPNNKIYNTIYLIKSPKLFGFITKK